MKKGLLKRAAAAVAAAVTAVSLCSCGGGGDTPADGDETVTTTAAVSAAGEMRDIPSTELVKEIKIGWSLGNTLDAPDANDVTAETSWGNPVTTKEMILAVKDAGFNIVRIPVTWRTHLDGENNIDKAWLDRVQEVVDYAYEEGMFVIVNAHHEEWYDPYYDTEAEVAEKLKKLWTQIGERFADYNERLIFEGMNEPRKRNTALEWNGGDKEGHEVVNRLNAAFVETIRGLGGNNAKRHLMLPSYAASSTAAALDDLVLPEGDDKIIVSVHAYLPYEFALGGNMEKREFTPDDSSSKEITDLMSRLKTKYTDNGIAVIIGEFGARAKGNAAVRAEWAKYYVSKAKEIGVPCIWWDNNSFLSQGEDFGLLNRKTCQWEFPDIVEGLMAGVE
ncbi:MAG: glycoside hydrolase family 5 protein [Ruminococcus sp.]|nr:glycoside hydrolase family 5 protein [Ruminococcus sp.]MCM1380625.1 glycoside hydrolase family 5 protein [Muribaculaceae bacterium]MCM1478367.1 glycoside hydrolase family 5 protein [Muribaculaceae bacterium]